eukprot:1176432-Prorocentrum_minimum.AAC.2
MTTPGADIGSADQSDAGSAGMFSRWTNRWTRIAGRGSCPRRNVFQGFRVFLSNRTQEVQVYSHDRPIACPTHAGTCRTAACAPPPPRTPPPRACA